ncbi:hypothetical protein [Leptospira vanthielii]|nr:hypothetical protein [Leptospira vanthielii]
MAELKDFRRKLSMNKKLLVLILGVTMASGLAFCKKEEPVVEEKMESVEDAAKKVTTEVEKKVDAAVKTAEAEAKKAATGAINDATKDIKKPAGF